MEWLLTSAEPRSPALEALLCPQHKLRTGTLTTGTPVLQSLEDFTRDGSDFEGFGPFLDRSQEVVDSESAHDKSKARWITSQIIVIVIVIVIIIVIIMVIVLVMVMDQTSSPKPAFRFASPPALRKQSREQETA